MQLLTPASALSGDMCSAGPCAACAPMLTVRHVSRRFGGKAALADVSLDLAQGEIICLAGQSGCGKSTLLRIIAGVDRADAGSICLNGVEIAGPRSFVEPERRNIGFMFQDYALFPHLSAADNIGFGLRRLSRADARRRIAEVMDIVGVSHLAGRFPHMLSGGEQQRVALARALAPQPALMLMDEPFSNLDRGLSEHVREETLAVLRKLGASAIIVTHDPEEALAAGDRVVLMRDGQIVQAGSGRELHDAPNSLYAAEFFRPCNRLAGRVAGGQVMSALGAFDAPPGLAEGEAVVVCVRQHALKPAREGDGVAATVRGYAFLGDVGQMRLELPGAAQPLLMRTSGDGAARCGDAIWVQVERRDVYIFRPD